MFVWLMLGCSVKSGVTILQMDQQYSLMNTPDNRQSQFEWAMAEEYRNKAKEEYASSQFEDAERLAEQAVEWMNQASQKSNGTESDVNDLNIDEQADQDGESQ